MRKGLYGAMIMMSAAAGARAQGMIGMQAGVGYTLGYKGYITPTAEAYWLHKISHHFYFGAAVSFQRYSLLRPVTDEAQAGIMQAISIRHKTTYLYVCPKADMGIGYRNRVHIYAAAGPGLAAGGSQLTNQKTLFPGTSSIAGRTIIEAQNTSYNIPNIIVKGTLGISERLPTDGYWSIMLSQEFTMLPGSLSKGEHKISVYYAALTAGITHKYRQRELADTD